MKTENPMMEHSALKMIQVGGAVGQWTLEGDMLIWKIDNERKINN